MDRMRARAGPRRDTNPESFVGRGSVAVLAPFAHASRRVTGATFSRARRFRSGAAQRLCELPRTARSRFGALGIVLEKRAACLPEEIERHFDRGFLIRQQALPQAPPHLLAGPRGSGHHAFDQRRRVILRRRRGARRLARLRWRGTRLGRHASLPVSRAAPGERQAGEKQDGDRSHGPSVVGERGRGNPHPRATAWR